MLRIGCGKAGRTRRPLYNSMILLPIMKDFDSGLLLFMKLLAAQTEAHFYDLCYITLAKLIHTRSPSILHNVAYVWHALVQRRGIMIWTLRSWSLRCPLSHVSRSQYRSFSLKQSRWTEYHGPQRILPAPSFREQVSRTGELESFSEKVKRPSVGNQVLVRIEYCCIIVSNTDSYILLCRSSHLGHSLYSALQPDSRTMTPSGGRTFLPTMGQLGNPDSQTTKRCGEYDITLLAR